MGYNPVPPKETSRSFKAGWKARLAGKKNSDCCIRIPNRYEWSEKSDNWIEVNCSGYWSGLSRKQDWHRGYLMCSRALGRLRKAERQVKETIRLNEEHDMLVELAEEYAA